LPPITPISPLVGMTLNLNSYFQPNHGCGKGRGYASYFPIFQSEKFRF
jgi:hypothetical protein